DRALHGRAIRSRRHDADRAPVSRDGISVPRDRAVRHLEADEPPRDAGRAHLLDRVLADEVTLLRLHDPSEAGLERVRRLVDVVAVERVRHLEAERIAGAEADRRDTIMAARVEQRIPEPFG